MLVTNLPAWPTSPPPCEKKKAGCKTLLVVVPARDRPRDRRLARARQAAKPEDASLVLSLRPVVYLVEEADARVAEADRLVLLRVRVEGRVPGVRQLVEWILGVSVPVSGSLACCV
jgi:hypothetical protein